MNTIHPKYNVCAWSANTTAMAQRSQSLELLDATTTTTITTTTTNSIDNHNRVRKSHNHHHHHHHRQQRKQRKRLHVRTPKLDDSRQSDWDPLDRGC